MNRVVMVSGRAGAGKTTFSNYCAYYLAEYGIFSQIVPFARGVKDTAKCMGWDGKKDDRGRKLLQEIGNCGREYDENLWAIQARNSISKLFNGGYVDQPNIEVAFIDDWRFMNEGGVIDEKFDTIKVRIIRKEEDYTLYGTPLYNDASEVGLPEGPFGKDLYFYEFSVFNTITLEWLKKEAERFCDTYLIRRK
jgi:hypothetical protein